MFGWRLVGHHFNQRGQSMYALGFELRTFTSGERWCDLTFGRHQWTFVHYPRYLNRLTGHAITHEQWVRVLEQSSKTAGR